MAALPALRQELALQAGPDAPDGTPTWTLHDPAANRFFQLSWPAFELLSRWALGNARAVLDAVNRETTLRVGQAEFDSLLRMLREQHLLVAFSREDTRQLAAQAEAMRLPPMKWLLKNYLFFRVPLARPMHWLQRASPLVAWAFRPGFWMGIALLALIGLMLAARRWDEFTHTFMSYANWQGLVVMACSLSLAKVLHELGHAFTATRFGCKVPAMGVAFMVMWPVLYTDTNEAWKLRSRRQRLAIGAAGMLSELALASVALVAWSLLPESPAWGPARSACFVLATSTWLLTLAINASPFMRFDGYFLLADLVNLPNLHERSFALARWWLRERLFGWGDPPPEQFPITRRRWVIAFALATWLYRLVLYAGIALLVYHAFFKALGLALMLVEIGWFIVRPVAYELRAWALRRDAFSWNGPSRRTVLLITCVLGVAVWPWQATVRAPGVLGAQQVQALYVPLPARLKSELPPAGELVRPGQVVVQLDSPELALKLGLAQARERQLGWQLTQQPFDQELRSAGPALHKRWEATEMEVAGLQSEIERLSLVAPFEAQAIDVADDARPGSWLAGGERLLQLVGPSGTKADVFVDEASLAALAEVQEASFYPATLGEPGVHCSIVRKDPVQLGSLDAPAVASVHGGAIPSQRTNDGRLQPLHPVFRIRLERCDREVPPRFELVGVAHFHGERRSLLEEGLRRAIALWRREASL